LALFGAEGTREDVRRSASPASIGRIVVDDAVAVVVDAIARFRDGIDCPDAHEHSILTLLRAIFTWPDVGLSALRANADGTIIDHSVAIVIQTIAGFGLRIGSPNANEPARLALVRPELARADIGLSALRSGTGRHIVNDAVAIIVLGIARFRLRIDSANTR